MACRRRQPSSRSSFLPGRDIVADLTAGTAKGQRGKQTTRAGRGVFPGSSLNVFHVSWVLCFSPSIKRISGLIKCLCFSSISGVIHFCAFQIKM